MSSPWDGAVRVLRDVVIDRPERDELLAVSNAPAVVGEAMSLDLMGGGRSMALKVRVLESRPVIIEGCVRHRIRLAMTPAVIHHAAPEPAASMPVRVAEAG